jgi:hypothetical protein
MELDLDLDQITNDRPNTSSKCCCTRRLGGSYDRVLLRLG